MSRLNDFFSIWLSCLEVHHTRGWQGEDIFLISNPATNFRRLADTSEKIYDTHAMTSFASLSHRGSQNQCLRKRVQQLKNVKSQLFEL